MKRKLCALSFILISFNSITAYSDDLTCNWNLFSLTEIVNCLHNTKHKLNATFDSVQDEAGATALSVGKLTKGVADNTLTKATTTLNTVNVIKTTTDTLQTTIQKLATTAQTIGELSDDTLDLLKYYSDQDLQELRTWLNSGCDFNSDCYRFRKQIETTFLFMPIALNKTFELQHVMMEGPFPGAFPALPPIDVGPVQEQIKNIPPILLFAIYKGLSAAEGDFSPLAFADYPAAGPLALAEDSGVRSITQAGYSSAAPMLQACSGTGCSKMLNFVNAALDQATGRLDELLGMYKPQSQYGFATLADARGGKPEALVHLWLGCQSFLDDEEALTYATTIIGWVGEALKFIGAFGEALAAAMSIDTVEGGAAAAGYASVALRINLVESVGLLLGGGGEAFLALANEFEVALDQCVSEANQSTLMCMLEPTNLGAAQKAKKTLTKYCADTVYAGLGS